jgi:hypothetical protein
MSMKFVILTNHRHKPSEFIYEPRVLVTWPLALLNVNVEALTEVITSTCNQCSKWKFRSVGVHLKARRGYIIEKKVYSRSQWPRGVRSRFWLLGRWDRGFESPLQNGCFLWLSMLLIMMGWDWRLGTAAITRLSFILWVNVSEDPWWWCRLGITLVLSTRALWQSF